ncbi:hypothetical protein HPB51_012983 [Rhipicephalus microplus]|uniref:RED-like N-terminal domain-containing protein n=1 Tax=Rhipicephalus microplus TaxID=6941 RepID=A0A9J6F3N5_RHIMP|nr:hypothetical protein HPB51_012983 [Rhipicephalus microplus]
MENITFSEARKKVSLFSGRTYADAARRGAGRRLVTVGTQYSFADACTSLPPTKQPQAAPTFHVPEVELHQTPGTTQTTETPLSSDKPPLASEGPPEAMEVTPGSSASKMLTESSQGGTIYRLLFRPRAVERNDLFLPNRMAYVIELDDEYADSDIPTTLIRSKKDCPNLEAIASHLFVVDK